MKKISLPVKIGTLMTLAILLISATGYLSYRSLSSIVASIQVKSAPDLRILAIREISNDIDKAENSVRLYTHTRKRQDIEPYYATIAGFDDEINRIRDASIGDTMLLTQIDTISSLIEENILIWNRMLALHHTDSLDRFIRKLSAKVAVGMLSDKNNERSILRRIFGKRPDAKLAQEEIIRDLDKIEKQDSIQNLQLQATESMLAQTGSEIRERFNFMISRMEGEVIRSISRKAVAADKLAMNTYRWLAMFTLLGTLLVILVLIVVVKYSRKTRDYQLALIRSKEETEELARTKELFMANMSHEIRTPVNAIYGFTEQLLYRSFDDKSRELLDIIKSSSDHLVKLVNDILDFSKLQNASIELEKSHFQIKKVCEEIQLLFEKRAMESHTHLAYSIGKSTPLVLLGDSYRLKQILINLVGNAVKFTADGEIHFSVDCVMRSADNLDLILKVADTGIGISDDMQERVFDDFTQAETDTTRKYGGTGLGLSIVKKLVELHQGSITLKSQPQKGTTITCVLPYIVGKWDQLPVITQKLFIPETVKSLKLLVVDDEEYNRMLFRTILNRWNVQYDEAPDGMKALEKLRSSKYNLVFMDVRMPGPDGLKTTASIRNELGINSSDLPVIGISATHSADDLQKFRQCGMNTFLPKPFTEKMLLDVILSVSDSFAGKLSATEITVSAADQNGTPKVDLRNLYHLADQDTAFVKQMLDQFMISTREGLEIIQQAVEAGNADEVLETAHKIASPCKHLGANGLYSSLKALEEEAGNHKNMVILAQLSGNSLKEFSDIEKVLQDHLLKIG